MRYPFLSYSAVTVTVDAVDLSCDISLRADIEWEDITLISQVDTRIVEVAVQVKRKYTWIPILLTVGRASIKYGTSRQTVCHVDLSLVPRGRQTLGIHSPGCVVQAILLCYPG